MADSDTPFAQFSGVVRSRDALEEIVGLPPAKVVDKELDHLDELCTAFISRSPFCLIATAGGDGHIDISPKGDPEGFVRVLDSTTLAIPDRPGNRRADTFHNLLSNPNIGILFLIPGKGETLRVRGEARIVADPALNETMAAAGKVPALALVVHVRTAFIHCPKCVIRSQLWEDEARKASDGLADIGEAMVRHTNSTLTVEEMFLEAQAEGLVDLY